MKEVIEKIAEGDPEKVRDSGTVLEGTSFLQAELLQ